MTTTYREIIGGGVRVIRDGEQVVLNLGDTEARMTEEQARALASLLQTAAVISRAPTGPTLEDKDRFPRGAVKSGPGHRA